MTDQNLFTGIQHKKHNQNINDAPLTSIMGLMSLIKQDDYAAPKEYIQMLEQAVYTLDGKIRQIISDVDSNVVGNGVGGYQ